MCTCMDDVSFFPVVLYTKNKIIYIYTHTLFLYHIVSIYVFIICSSEKYSIIYQMYIVLLYVHIYADVYI